jgi:hypothetical protein
MGGLILRGALPRILEGYADAEVFQVQFGHYVSLSSPQLGVQAGWAVPWLWWRNLSKYTGRFSGQLTQLAMQDGRRHGIPYLAALADKDGKYIAALSKFRCRTCVSMTTGDALIPTCSGLIQKENPFNKSFLQSGFKGTWRFEARGGTDPHGAFERYLQSHLVSKVPHMDADSERITGSALGLTPFIRPMDPMDSEDPFNLRAVSSVSTPQKQDEFGSEESTIETSGRNDFDDIDEDCITVDADEPPPQTLPQSSSYRTLVSDACSKSIAKAEEEEDASSKSTSASIGTNDAINVHTFPSPTIASSISFSSEASNYEDPGTNSTWFDPGCEAALVKAWLKQKGYKDINVPKVMRRRRAKYPLHSAVKDNDAEMVWLLLKCGANVEARNSENQTPVEVAEKLQKNDSHSQVLHLLTNSEDLFGLMPSSVCSRPLCWRNSADGAVRFPQEALEGLCSVSWQRVPVTASLVFQNMHVFLMAKKSEQRTLENRLSRECVRGLVEIFAD